VREGRLTEKKDMMNEMEVEVEIERKLTVLLLRVWLLKI